MQIVSKGNNLHEMSKPTFWEKIKWKKKNVCLTLSIKISALLSSKGVHGEHSESAGGVYDISNRRRLGLTEWEAVNEMKNGVLEIIKEEAKLTWMPKPVEELWKPLHESNSSSLLKKHLTPEVYAKLKDKKTSLGGTLAHCISSGKDTVAACCRVLWFHIGRHCVCSSVSPTSIRLFVHISFPMIT